jgi:catechol 2,3-dioxygenase-like lactoylglutathione lyase family enzyme
MIDHIGIGVRNLDASVAFYEKALAPLGYKMLMKFPEAAGFGRDGKPDFWIGRSETAGPAHVAITGDRKQVEAFHRAALDAGGSDNGGPGIRAHYHPNYYGAFIKDLDGHNIEAVSHMPPGAKAPAKKAAAKKTAKKPEANKAAKKPAAKKATKKAAPKKAAKKR